jgi:signal peptidase
MGEENQTQQVAAGAQAAGSASVLACLDNAVEAAQQTTGWQNAAARAQVAPAAAPQPAGAGAQAPEAPSANGARAAGKEREGGAFATFINALTWVLVVIVVCMMVITICGKASSGAAGRELFGYSAFVVESDSMSATDFGAGDVIITHQVDPSTLAAGDIITFTSRGSSNYGETVTHKIRELTTDSAGNPGFVTYGTTTGTDDESVVTYSQVIGQYAFALPNAGYFIEFLKTVPGYFVCIFAPFALLILLQGANTVKLAARYRREVAAERAVEAAQSAEGVTGAPGAAVAAVAAADQERRAYQEENARLLAEVEELRAKVANASV